MRPPAEIEEPEGDAEGVVIFVRVVEKSEPFIDIVLPGLGCCWQAASRAVTTVGRYLLVPGLNNMEDTKESKYTVREIELAGLYL